MFTPALRLIAVLCLTAPLTLHANDHFTPPGSGDIQTSLEPPLPECAGIEGEFVGDPQQEVRFIECGERQPWVAVIEHQQQCPADGEGARPVWVETGAVNFVDGCRHLTRTIGCYRDSGNSALWQCVADKSDTSPREEFWCLTGDDWNSPEDFPGFGLVQFMRDECTTEPPAARPDSIADGPSEVLSAVTSGS